MLWFWTFIILVQLIMLNMLLAIVMDVYTEVKSGLDYNAPTVFSQMSLIWRRWKQKRRGTRMPLEYVLKKLVPQALDTKLLKKEESELQQKTLTPSALMAQVPGLGEEQAVRILVTATENWAAAGKDPAALSDTSSRVLELKVDQMHLHETVQHQFSLQRLSACLTASTTRDILKLVQKQAQSQVSK